MKCTVSSLCFLSVLSIIFLLISNHDSVSGQTIEEIVKHGVTLWKSYCASKSVNQTQAIEVNKCMLKSVNLNDKLMSECMKKFLSAKDQKTSMQRLHQAQCFNPREGPTSSNKLNEEYGRYLACASGNKRSFDPCHGSSTTDRRMCMQRVLLRFTKCAHKQGLITMK